MPIENLEKRFGTVAVKRGFITIEQLVEAMNIQITEDVQEGKHRLLGSILFDLGFITDLQIERVLKALDLSDYSSN